MKVRAFKLDANGVSEVQDDVPDGVIKMSEDMEKVLEALPPEMSKSELANMVFNIIRSYGMVDEADEVLTVTMLALKAFRQLGIDEIGEKSVDDLKKFN